MADPVYRLQIVLAQREEEKRDKEDALSEAQKALKLEQKKLEAKIEERKLVDVKKGQCSADFQAAIMKPGCMISEEAERHDFYQKKLDAEAKKIDAEVVAQKTAVRRAEQRVEDAKMELLKAATELQAMEKHKENWQKQVKKELAEKEQLQQEEIGEAMWLAQRRKEELRGATGGGGTE